MERWNLTDQEGARRRARRVLLRDQSPIQPAPVSRKKGEMGKRNPIPQKSRLVVLRCDVRQKNQQQQDSGMEQLLERGRGADNGWRRMEWGESGTCDSGAGSLFCHPPRAGGVGAQRRPRKREAPAPQQTPLTGPPRLSAPSHLHTPPDPTHRVQARLLAPPSFSLFAIFNPRGNMATDVFHVKGGFFLAPGNQSWRDMDFQMPMSCLRRHLPPRKQEGGAASMGGRRLVEVPLPTTHRSGASSRPPLPPGRIPPPPLHLLTRRE